MTKTIKFSVEKSDEGKRLDLFLTEKLKDFSRTYVKKLIENKSIKVNNLIISNPSKKVTLNNNIVLKMIFSNIYNLKPNFLKLDIMYEDDDLLVINKPKGLTVHPGAGNKENTLVNALIYKYKKKLSDINGFERPGIVHRIDKNTSGLLVVAKNNKAHVNLAEQFSAHSIKRKYSAFIWGVIRPMKGRIETFIKRSNKNRKIMTVDEFKGKNAITNYEIKKIFNSSEIPKISFIEFYLETGRTHQIRVHMKYKKTSILNDDKYGKKVILRKKNLKFEKILSKIKGQALHASSHGFKHPSTKKDLHFTSELPNCMKELYIYLAKLSD